MSLQRIILVGGGEHARVVADAIRSRADLNELVGFVDPDPAAPLGAEGCRHLGDEDVLPRYPDAHILIAFGSAKHWARRCEVVRRVQAPPARWATVVHAAAWVSPGARVDEGTVIMAGAIVQTGARIGALCVINSGAVVEHDVILGTNVHVAPRAALGGGVEVGRDSYVGLGASVRDHVAIGETSFIGMGSVVVRSIGPRSSVRGVPAR